MTAALLDDTDYIVDPSMVRGLADYYWRRRGRRGGGGGGTHLMRALVI